MAEPIRLLLVDDDDVDRLVVRRAFRTTALAVTLTELDRGDAVLGQLEGGAFDCCLLDLNLPGRDGLELLREARARGVRTPLIVLTGHGSEELAVQLMRAGAADYLSKANLTPQRLVYSVQQAMRLAQAEAKARDVELALRESEENFRRLADNLPDVVVRFDRAHRHVYINKAITRSTGMSPEAYIGKTNQDLGFPPEMAKAWDEMIDKAFEGNPLPVTFPFQGPNGYQCFEARITPERGVDGTVATVLTIVRDVTEAVHQQEVDRKRAEFERQLIGIVSHDLRNPISAILMAASGLQRRPNVEEERLKRSLSLIVRSSDRAMRMIADLLDFTQARLGGGIPIERGFVNLRQVAEGAVGETRAAYPDRAIHLDAPGDITGRWDGDRIAQLLTNLLANAVKYSPADSSVHVRVADEGEGVLLEVTNQGEPIPDDLMPVLFEPYQRGPNKADMATRSIGLGLFIVEQIVKGHGGRIDVRSTKAEGTIFRVTLPSISGPASAR